MKFPIYNYNWSQSVSIENIAIKSYPRAKIMLRNPHKGTEKGQNILCLRSQNIFRQFRCQKYIHIPKV